MKNILSEARRMSVSLQGIAPAKADLMLLNQAICSGNPGLMTNALKRCRRWEKIVDAKAKVMASIIQHKHEREDAAAFSKAFSQAQAQAAKPLFV